MYIYVYMYMYMYVYMYICICIYVYMYIQSFQKRLTLVAMYLCILNIERAKNFGGNFHVNEPHKLTSLQCWPHIVKIYSGKQFS